MGVRAPIPRFHSMKIQLPKLLRALRLYIRNKSVNAWLQAAFYVCCKLTRKAPPITAIFAVTYRCQCTCEHCYAMFEERQGVNEMSTEELKKTLDQIKKLGALQVLFTGGEPLLRKDICDLVSHAHKIGLITRMSTNGDLLTRDCVKELKRAGLNQCGVSIDDIDPTIHDRLRGIPGLYEKAIQGLRYLHEFGIDSKIMTYATHENVTEGLERILELGRKLQVVMVHITIALAAGRWTDASHEVLTEEEMARIRMLQTKNFLQLEFPTPYTQCCITNNSVIYISAINEVTPCPAVPYAIGNLEQDSLAAIWKRHVSALRLECRGSCPMNEDKGREALSKHSASVLRGNSEL
ncbi:MAG: radical SAM protein [Candidatus Aminicenantes bacterium]|nr:radical SAM protein [Candidatus Aminicenantes bacterium]